MGGAVIGPLTSPTTPIGAKGGAGLEPSEQSHPERALFPGRRLHRSPLACSLTVADPPSAKPASQTFDVVLVVFPKAGLCPSYCPCYEGRGQSPAW
jgi:hypothetical protein